MAIRIKLVDSLQAIDHFRTLEHLVWGVSLESAIPAHMIVTTIHNGGGLLAAYAEDGPPQTGGMVGITYWWPGLDRPTTTSGGLQASTANGNGAAPHLQLKMCSHMAGVLPAWRGTGLGLQLKLAQRAAILEQGMTEWVTWTYDPLIRTNGAFNIHRLGAVCNSYHVNLYGEMPSGINAGVPSDRCQVDWWLRSERVEERATGDAWRRQTHFPQGAQVLHAERNATGLLAPPASLPAMDGSPLALPLPEDIYAIRNADRPLGLAWRLWMREALLGAFAAGYLLVDCLRDDDGTWRYLLVMS
jgi:predicted GNAT superfamily acetyltransferase